MRAGVVKMPHTLTYYYIVRAMDETRYNKFTKLISLLIVIQKIEQELSLALALFF